MRIIDAREKQRRLKRQDSFKRERIQSQLEEQLERIATLESLKEQIMQQRKTR